MTEEQSKAHQVEMRWLVPAIGDEKYKTTQLQYRCRIHSPTPRPEWTDWQTVPLVGAAALDESPAREPLADGRDHITVTGKFQSDKYPWCPVGFVALKTTDPMARDLLATYAQRRREVDKAFSDDLLDALGKPLI